MFHQIIEILLQVYIPQNYVQIAHFMKAEHCFEHILVSTTGHLVSFYYQDQNAVSGLYCSANFSNLLLFFLLEDKLNQENVLTKHSGFVSKIKPSCNSDIIFKS